MQSQVWAGLLGVFAVACASAPPKSSASAKPVEAPIYRSSIDAVLAHRAELALTEAQVEKLQACEQARQKQELDLRAQHHARSKPAEGSSAAPVSNPAAGPLADAPNNATPPPGLGAGGGRMGGHHGGHRGGGHSGAAPTPPDLQQQLDDLDTRAYVEAEAALDEPQKEPARAVAERYREQLWDYQQAQAR